MATFSINTLTVKGTALMATALATEQSIVFTGLAIGDGAAPENPAALTDIVHKLIDVDISKVYIAPAEPGTSIFRASFQNKTGAAFYFREVGIYARLGGTSDSPILYGYANAGDTADLIDTVEEGSLLMQTLICPIVTGSADVQYIDNPSQLITRQDLLEYLPRAGGTMTGYITLDPDGGTKNNYNIGFDFDKAEGAGLALRSSKREGDSGSFVVYAKNGSAATSLTGKPTGELVWDGSQVLFTDNGFQMKKSHTSGHLTIHGGTNTEDGSGLFLYGESHSSQGLFLLRASGNGKLVDLQGFPDGRLIWNNSEVITSAGGVIKGVLTNRNWAHPVIGSQGFDGYGNLVGGATLYMFPANEATYKGGFVLRAVREDGSYVELCGKNDGTLSWNNADIHLVGEIKWYAGTSVPTGYLRCDGSAVSRTTYARLFAAIGTTYGMGDGSTTFNLPNLTNARMVASSNVDIFGNGKALGLTNGTDLYGLSSQNTYYTTGTLVGAKENYNANVAASGGGQGQIANASILGITPDPLKSGVAGTVSLATAVMPIIKY